MDDQNQTNPTPPQPDPTGSSFTPPKRTLLQPSAGSVDQSQPDLEPTQPQQPGAPQEPQNQPPLPSSTSTAHKPAIQPSAAFAAEMQAQQAATPAAPVASPQPVKADVSSIYPDATKGINIDAPKPHSGIPVAPKDTELDLETTTYDEGYSIGGSIFWYQFFAVLILEVFSRFFLGIFNAAALAGLGITAYFVILYASYRVVKENAVKDPLWPTLFGLASQSVIVTGAFWIFNYVFAKLFLGHGNTASVGLGLSLISIPLLIGSFVATYFLTKYSWGVAFRLYGKIKNKLIARVIGIGLITIFVGVLGYHFVTLTHLAAGSNAAKNATTSHQAVGLTQYNVAGDPSYSVNFYKGSKIASDGRLTYTAGPTQSTGITIATESSSNAITSCPNSDSPHFNFQIQGSIGLVCVSSPNALTSYIGHINVNGTNYAVSMYSLSYLQSQTTVQEIFDSINIE